MKNSTEELTIKYADYLDEELLPKMKGNMGLWDDKIKPTLRRKRSFLYVLAERQAKLEKQIEWIAERQEYYRKLRG